MQTPCHFNSICGKKNQREEDKVEMLTKKVVEKSDALAKQWEEKKH